MGQGEITGPGCPGGREADEVQQVSLQSRSLLLLGAIFGQ